MTCCLLHWSLLIQHLWIFLCDIPIAVEALGTLTKISPPMGCDTAIIGNLSPASEMWILQSCHCVKIAKRPDCQTHFPGKNCLRRNPGMISQNGKSWQSHLPYARKKNWISCCGPVYPLILVYSSKWVNRPGGTTCFFAKCSIYMHRSSTCHSCHLIQDARHSTTPRRLWTRTPESTPRVMTPRMSRQNEAGLKRIFKFL